MSGKIDGNLDPFLRDEMEDDDDRDWPDEQDDNERRGRDEA